MELKEIIETKVCSYCGGKLEIAVVDEYDWIICRPCSRVSTYVSPEVYKLASAFVESHPYGYFSFIHDETLRKQANIDKMCSIIKWLDRQKEAALEVDDGKKVGS